MESEKNQKKTEKKEVVNAYLPGTTIKVPVKIGDIEAAPGCYLAKVVCLSWAEARDLERTEYLKNIGLADPKSTVSRVVPQEVAGRKVPCYLYDLPFEDYDIGMESERLFKQLVKKKNAKKRAGDKNAESLNAIYESGYNPCSDYDPTSSEALENIMKEEINSNCEARKKGLSEINKLIDENENLNARQIATILNKNEWTVRDDIDHIKEVKKQYYFE